MRTIIGLSLLLLTVGCASNRSYDVAVKNQTDGWLTIGLIKEGGPIQPDWEAPEAALSNDRKPSAVMWEQVPPGKTADTGAVKGRFFRHSEAVLRVYEGKLGLEGMMAISKGQPNRIDIPLHAGFNRFEVSQQGDELVSSRQEPVTLMTQQ
jgi:hypothetical protein